MRIFNLPGILMAGLLASAALASAQSGLTCAATAGGATPRAEGLAEPLGDVLLTCTGGNAGATVTGELNLAYSVPVTNKLPGPFFTGIVLAIDTGAGPVPSDAPARPGLPNEVLFQGISFTVPADGRVALRVSHVRGNTTVLAPGLLVTVKLSFTLGGTTVNNSQLNLGSSRTGLLALVSPGIVPCAGADLPATISMPALFAAATPFFSTRFTEGFTEAFQKADAFSDAGTRIRVSYTGFPADARLFVPDAVAGSSTIQPTSGGDLGLPASGGLYEVSAAGSLLLIRVLGAGSDGAGGTLAMPPPVSGGLWLDRAGEVELHNGAGSVVYEVVDSNFAVRESAQFPTFIHLNPSGGASGNPVAAVSFAPVSTIAAASTAPVPRFLDATPPSDCSTLGDCDAAYFPHLSLRAPPLELTVPALSPARWLHDVDVLNSGAGILNWRASVTYQKGAGWLEVSPATGTGFGSIRVVVHPETLEAGVYRATLTVDAGPLAGSRSLPVTLTVTAAAAPAPAVTRVSNAASMLPGTAALTWTAIQGTNLAATTRSWNSGDFWDGQLPIQLDGVSVLIDGRPAYVSYISPTQINVIAPGDSRGGTVPLEVVAPHGRSSPVPALLSRLSPALFMLSAEGGKYVAAVNTDGTYAGKPNLIAGAVTRPVAPGGIVLLFGTGFGQTNPPAVAGQVSPEVSPLARPPLVRIGGVEAVVKWAGLISPGLYQLNVVVPDVADGDQPVEAEAESFRTQGNAYLTVKR
ncbi:MAG: hypothetical protein IT159_06145 [Bryobacterales bacterium]|nr:hypothetical protein [Bryobacterales bacterium]